MRPFAPFNVRPSKRRAPVKGGDWIMSLSAAEMDTPQPASKARRRPVKAQARLSPARLRILGRDIRD